MAPVAETRDVTFSSPPPRPPKGRGDAHANAVTPAIRGPTAAVKFPAGSTSASSTIESSLSAAATLNSVSAAADSKNGNQLSAASIHPSQRRSNASSSRPKVDRRSRHPPGQKSPDICGPRLRTQTVPGQILGVALRTLRRRDRAVPPYSAATARTRSSQSKSGFLFKSICPQPSARRHRHLY
jgi:hypothetical protein